MPGISTVQFVWGFDFLCTTPEMNSGSAREVERGTIGGARD